ncbi:curli assembly protein CsgF [Pseudoalteromonas umbrosa]|uniref:curli assembly protein CsgF n=1 Tax=Pseudoalteromonas umbrosa TaxID=3048489 RepID=UPI0024C3DF0F|nr:curli assembly protein CsgF [Pseudoalteromonas sp. B95]MDK1288873.1 curli assembly protein CsgF [Pseudoalteromonas sp. B95]
MVEMKTIILAYLSFFTLSVSATEIVYKPINPSFGGNPLNASMLLNKANSQNKHRAPIIEKSYGERFQESLERTYLNRMVREISDMAFGDDVEDSIFNEDSIFTSGDYEIQVITSTPDSITVQIKHIDNGDITIIEVPRFG